MCSGDDRRCVSRPANDYSATTDNPCMCCALDFNRELGKTLSVSHVGVSLWLDRSCLFCVSDRSRTTLGGWWDPRILGRRRIRPGRCGRIEWRRLYVHASGSLRTMDSRRRNSTCKSSNVDRNRVWLRKVAIGRKSESYSDGISLERLARSLSKILSIWIRGIEWQPSNITGDRLRSD